MGTSAASDPTASLDRHQGRRDLGLPTVSVLSGPAGLAVSEGRRWAEGRGRPVVQVDDPRAGAMAGAWASDLARGRDLRADVVARLARRAGGLAADLGPRIARMSPIERTLFLEAAGPGQDGGDSEAACRWILERSAGGTPPDAPGLADRLAEATAGPDCGDPVERALVALADLVPPESAPVLLVARGTDGLGASPWVEAAARSMARLALLQPRLTPILAVEAADLDAYLGRAPESRAKALIRSGVVRVAGLDGEEIARRLAASVPGAAPGLAGPIQRLALDGASGELVGLFVDVARETAAAAGPETADRARSSAERFLAERLGSLAATAGRFAINASLDIPFGPGRRMEVDLVCLALKLAIEIDGYYHFRDVEAYRRDRRKDFLLQSRGYLVVRVLAEDVVPRLEEILDLILAAVESRRNAPDAPNRDATP